MAMAKGWRGRDVLWWRRVRDRLGVSERLIVVGGAIYRFRDERGAWLSVKKRSIVLEGMIDRFSDGRHWVVLGRKRSTAMGWAIDCFWAVCRFGLF